MLLLLIALACTRREPPQLAPPRNLPEVELTHEFPIEDRDHQPAALPRGATPPRLVSQGSLTDIDLGLNVCPAYTLARLQIGETGAVLDGELLRARFIQRGTSYSDDELFLLAKGPYETYLMTWQFEPALLEGKPITAWYYVTTNARCE